MMLATLLFVAGVIVGYAFDRWRERRFWLPFYRRYLTTTPPTYTVKVDWPFLMPGDPEWGYFANDPGPFPRAPAHPCPTRADTPHPQGADG